MDSLPLILAAILMIFGSKESPTSASILACISESVAERKRSLSNDASTPRYPAVHLMHAANMRRAHKRGGDRVSFVAIVSYICATYRTVSL